MREVQRHRRMRIRGDTPIKGPPALMPYPIMRHQGSSRSPDALAPHPVFTRLKVVEQPFQRVRPAGPPLGKKPVYKAPLTAILTAAPQSLAESFRLLPLAGCRTRLLRAWPHAFLWARRCPPSKYPLGCWVCCVQCRCKCIVSCCCLCAPSSFLIRAWDRKWRSFPRRIRMYYRHRLGLERNLGKLLKERENHLLKREV